MAAEVVSVMDISVIIPTIKGREVALERALLSVSFQDTRFDWHALVELDTLGEGPAVMRNRGAMKAQGEWLAFLDDDDELKSGHLDKLMNHALETGVDVVYPWFDIVKGARIRNDLDPLRRFGHVFDGDALARSNYIPVTALVRSEKFREVGGFPIPGSQEWPHKDCEDWALWLALHRAGAKFSHLPERTWVWNWHSRNTSGLPYRASKMYGEGE